MLRLLSVTGLVRANSVLRVTKTVELLRRMNIAYVLFQMVHYANQGFGYPTEVASDGPSAGKQLVRQASVYRNLERRSWALGNGCLKLQYWFR